MNCSSSGAEPERRLPSDPPASADPGPAVDSRPVATLHREKIAALEELVAAYEDLLIRIGTGDLDAAVRSFEATRTLVDSVRSVDASLRDRGASLLPSTLSDPSRRTVARVEELGARVAGELEGQRHRVREELGRLHEVKGAVRGYRPYGDSRWSSRRVDFSG